MRLRTTRHIETAVVTEIGHYPVDVVGIKRINKAIKYRDYVICIRHLRDVPSNVELGRDGRRPDVHGGGRDRRLAHRMMSSLPSTHFFEAFFQPLVSIEVLGPSIGTDRMPTRAAYVGHDD